MKARTRSVDADDSTPPSASSAGRLLVPREMLVLEEPDLLWRVASGALRIDSAIKGEHARFVRLALPGDFIGVERWAGTNDRLTLQALIDTRVNAVHAMGLPMMQILMETVVINHQRCREVVSLRTGSVNKRLRALFSMFAQVASHQGDEWDSQTSGFAVPRIADVSDLVDAAPATVSRALKSFDDLVFFQEGRQPKARLSSRLMRELNAQNDLAGSRTFLKIHWSGA